MLTKKVDDIRFLKGSQLSIYGGVIMLYDSSNARSFSTCNTNLESVQR